MPTSSPRPPRARGRGDAEASRLTLPGHQQVLMARATAWWSQAAAGASVDAVDVDGVLVGEGVGDGPVGEGGCAGLAEAGGGGVADAWHREGHRGGTSAGAGEHVVV